MRPMTQAEIKAIIDKKISDMTRVAATKIVAMLRETVGVQAPLRYGSGRRQVLKK